MLELIELLSKRSTLVVILATALAAISYYFHLGIVNIKPLEKLQFNNQPLSPEQIAYLFASICAIFILTAVIRGLNRAWINLRSSAAPNLSGLYDSDLHYDAAGLTRVLATIGVPAEWGPEKVIKPDSSSYDDELKAWLQAFDAAAGIEFYSRLHDMESRIRLLLMAEAIPNQAHKYRFRGFGNVTDWLRRRPEHCECGLIVPNRNVPYRHNQIDLGSLGKVSKMLTRGMPIVIQIEQLVHPNRRFQECVYCLFFVVRRGFFDSKLKFSEGIYFGISPVSGKYIAAGYTKELSLKPI